MILYNLRHSLDTFATKDILGKVSLAMFLGYYYFSAYGAESIHWAGVITGGFLTLCSIVFIIYNNIRYRRFNRTWQNMTVALVSLIFFGLMLNLFFLISSSF